MEIEREVVPRALHEIALDEIDTGAPQCGGTTSVFNSRRDHLDAALVCERDEIAQFLAYGIIVDSNVARRKLDEIDGQGVQQAFAPRARFETGQRERESERLH